MSFSERESFFPPWKPSQGLAFLAAFAAKAWAHIWVWPTRDTTWAWHTRKEVGGEPRLAGGTAAPNFPELWGSDANSGTYGPVSALWQATGCVYVS